MLYYGEEFEMHFSGMPSKLSNVLIANQGIYNSDSLRLLERQPWINAGALAFFQVLISQ